MERRIEVGSKNEIVIKQKKIGRERKLLPVFLLTDFWVHSILILPKNL